MEISEADTKGLYSRLTWLYHHDRAAFNAAYCFDDDTYKTYLNPHVLDGYPGLNLPTGIDVHFKGHAKKVLFIIEKIDERERVLPTLIRWNLHLCEEIAKTRRTARSQAILRSICNFILVRAAAEHELQVIVSRRSLIAAVLADTGRAPAPNAVKEALHELQAYYKKHDGVAPFEVVRWGTRGNLNDATTVRVVVPWYDHAEYTRAGEDLEQKHTKVWMEENERVLDAVIVREMQARENKPVLQAHLAEMYGFNAHVDEFIKANSVRKRTGGWEVPWGPEDDALFQAEVELQTTAPDSPAGLIEVEVEPVTIPETATQQVVEPAGYDLTGVQFRSMIDKARLTWVNTGKHDYAAMLDGLDLGLSDTSQAMVLTGGSR